MAIIVTTIINDVEPNHTTTNKNPPIIPKPTNFTQLKPTKPKTTTTIPRRWPTDLHADNPCWSPHQSHLNTNAHADALAGKKVSRLGSVSGMGEGKGWGWGKANIKHVEKGVCEKERKRERLKGWGIKKKIGFNIQLQWAVIDGRW